MWLHIQTLAYLREQVSWSRSDVRVGQVLVPSEVTRMAWGDRRAEEGEGGRYILPPMLLL